MKQDKLKEQIQKYLENVSLRPPATTKAIQHFEETCMRLPKDYKAFLSISNGLEDFIGDAYFRLYRVEELQQVNLDYNTQESAPGLFMIGSNGGGETYSYNTNKHMKLYLVPFIVYIHEDALYIAQNFLHLLRRCINREDLFETKYWLPKNHH